MNIINNRRMIRATSARISPSPCTQGEGRGEGSALLSSSAVVRRRRARRLVLWAVAPIAAALAPTAGAAVQLTGVSSGSASVSQNGSITTIRTSNNAILNFSQFNIAKGSTVDFLQPSPASRVLDHVNSATPSIVNGSLLSNGTVYLINPAGVIFGPGATVDVNRFYVAGSHMSDQDFLGNVDHFSGVSGIVSNSGTIHANQVYLVGSQVINQGSIVSPNGVVAMLSGSDVIVSEPGSHVTATVVPVVPPNSTGAAHTTDLRTNPMAAGDAYSLAIRHTGSIVAGNVVINGGGGQVQISGIIDASSATVGGTVSITGAEVDLLSASINASGPLGGGDIQIGGGPHGTGDLTHAQYVSLDSGTTINADATSNGAGGSIILWSDSSTASSAALSARGGPLGGNGGYVETSGPTLNVSVAPNVSSSRGTPGTWVLDPLGITIVNSTTDQGTAAFTGQSTINTQTIENALVAGDNVLITTNQTGATTPTLVQTAGALITVSLGTPVSLTLQANSDMTLSGGIIAMGSALTVELDQLNNASNAITINTAGISITGPLKILGGNVTLASTSSLSAASVQIASGTAITGESLTTGNVTINGAITTTAGDLDIGGTTSLSTGPTATLTVASGNVNITNSGAVSIGAPIITGGGSLSVTSQSFTDTDTSTVGITDGGGSGASPGSLTINTTSGSGGITISNPITWAGGTGRFITLEALGSITIGTGGSIKSTAGAGALPVSLYSTGAGTSITLTGPVNISGDFVADGGNFTISAPLVTPAPTILTALSASINNNKNPIAIPVISSTLTLGTVTVAGPLVTNGGDVSIGGITSFIDNQHGTITTGGGAVIITNTGLLSIGQAISTSGGSLTATLGNDFTTAGSGTITTGGGNITVITSSSDGVSIGNNVNTGGGSFTVIGQSFEDTATITDGGVGTSAGSLTVNTTSGSVAAIAINSPITWAGGTGRFVTLETSGAITIGSTGSITATAGTGSLPVSLFTTGTSSSITLTGPVNTTGDFVADGGNFVISLPTGTPVPTILTASTISINTDSSPAATPALTSTLTLGTVSFAGPVLANATSGDAVTIGGTTSFILNQSGAITTKGGNIVISNTGLIAFGRPAITAGGNFTATTNIGFTTSNSGSINTSSTTGVGGNVLLASTTSNGISIGNTIITGGGSFTATAEGFEDTALISDGGVATGTNSFSLNTTSGTSDITGLEVSWTAGSGRSVLVEGAGNITINAIAATGSTAIPVSLYTTSSTDTITLNGPVTASGVFISSGGNFTIAAAGSLTGNTINIGTAGTTPDSKPLISSAVTFGGAVVSHGTITVSATAFDVPSGGSINSNGALVNVNASGVVTLEGPITSLGGEVAISSGATLTSDSTGTITSTGGNVSLGGATGVSIGADVNTGGGNFTSSGETFANTATISDGGVDDSQVQGLAITTTGGDLTISGDINWAASHSPMTFTVPSTNFLQLSGTIEANPGEPLSFAGTAIVVSGSGSPTISGGAITFGALLPTATATGSPTGLTIFSTGAISLHQVGASGTPFGSLSIETNSTTEFPVTTLNGNVFSGNIDFAGSVVLPANVQVALTGGGIAEFDGSVEGPGGLTVVMPTDNENGSNDIPNEIRFNGNIGDSTPLAFVNLFPEASGIVGFQFGRNLNPPGVDAQQPLTTINIASGGAFEIDNSNPPPKNYTITLSTIDSYGPLSINIGSASTPNAQNLYAVGQNEKLSVYGNLSINTNGGTITTGDLSSIGNMTLNASRVNFLLRAATLNDSGTALVDSGVDFIAGGEMTLPGSAVFTAVSGPLVGGAFDVPGFVAQSFSPSSNIGVVSSEMKTAFSIVGAIPASVLFGGSNLLLDLTPNTLTTTVPFFVPPIPTVFDYPISGANPREMVVAGTVPLDFKEAFPPATPGPIVQQELKDDGLYTRDPSVEEILGTALTMAVYDDMPTRPRPRSADYRVVSNRLNSASAGAFLNSYKQVFGSDPQTKRTQMAASIQAAWDAYVTQNGDQTISGAGFAKYCAATPSASDAATNLRQLHGLRTDIGTLGLSFKEAQVAFQYNILTGLSAIGMREGDLAGAVAATPGNH